jgi:hypothetical protein
MGFWEILIPGEFDVVALTFILDFLFDDLIFLNPHKNNPTAVIAVLKIVKLSIYH